MSEMRRTVVVAPLRASVNPTLTVADVTEVWEYVVPPERIEWTDWMVLSSTPDKYPTYFGQYGQPWNGLGWRDIERWNPHVLSTTVWQRKLVRLWTDPTSGPMAEILDIETRTEHS